MKTTTKENYSKIKEDFISEVRASFSQAANEVSERNQKIQERDSYIYSDQLERSVDTPIGHDMTPVNWLRRTVEIHKNMFMSRGFQVISTYDTKDISTASDKNDAERLKIDNKKEKSFAEARKRVIDAIIKDNGGFTLFSELAEGASAIGDAAIKMYYDEDEQKVVLSPIESIENLYVVWGRDDFRRKDAVGFAYQVSKTKAVSEYGAKPNVATSPLGKPLEVSAQFSQTASYNQSTQPMVTILEVTGKIEGWKSNKGTLSRCKIGQETNLNATIIGKDLSILIDDPKKLPKYYIFPNKRQRRRPWGIPDVSDAAININITYLETLSDWRTVSSKINFPKWKAFGFSEDTQMPQHQPRKIQAIPLSENQDLVLLDQGNTDKLDFRSQMEELKEQFVRETGISRVLFDDPSVTLNSNQALITSMKPTSDIAEAKKQLWSPILEEMFRDAIELAAQYHKELKDIANGEYVLKVLFPSVMQKEDPIFQQMLLNRFNSNTISLQTFLESQGESKEEIDRIREELEDPVTAAILGRSVGLIAQNIIAPPDNKPQVKTNISLRGDLTPGQEANLASQQGFNDGPFPPSMGPQGAQGIAAQSNADNAGLLNGNPFSGGTPVFKGPKGQTIQGAGKDQRQQTGSPSNNQPGQGIVSQPGSGATQTSAQGAINQQNQQAGN